MARNVIVAAVDFSAISRQVLAHAADLAALQKCPMVVAHIVPEGRLRDWADTMGEPFDPQAGLAEIAERLAELIESVPQARGAVSDLRIGKPYPMLEAIVREHHAGTIVIGAHDILRQRLGSVAARCARSMPCDVLILRDWQGGSFHRIAVCVDYSPSSRAALERGITLACARHGWLEILHVVFPPDRDPWGEVLDQPLDEQPVYASKVRERARHRMEQFLSPFQDRLAACQWNTHFLEGEAPAAAITAHLSTQQFDLAVIGSHQGSWLEELVLGSNAERILHDSTSSILITRG